MSTELTGQERAVFSTADNPMRNMTGMAEALAARVEAETKAKIRYRMDTVVEEHLMVALQDLESVGGHSEHWQWRPLPDCPACQVQVAIERIGEVTV